MKRLKFTRLTSVLLLSGLGISLFISAISPGTASATTISCNWTSTTQINCATLDGFTQTNVSGNNMTLDMSAHAQGMTTCDVQMQVNNYASNPKTATLTTESDLGCPSGFNIPHATNTANLTNNYPGSTTGNPPPPPKNGITCTWVFQGEAKCGNDIYDLSTTQSKQLVLEESNPPLGAVCPNLMYIADYQNARNGVIHGASGLACVRDTLIPVTFTNTWNQAPKPKSDVSGDNAPNIAMQCSVSIFNPATWLICPLVSAAQGAIEGLTAAIDSLLTINTNEIFSTPSTKGTTSAGFYTAWNTFRIFGAGLIVIAGLVMLIAQAVGTDLIDAYTIHKVLPRILIAIVGITLSWWLLQFAITLSNDVGTGIRTIIYTPFEGIGTTVKVNGGAATVGALVGTATFLTLGLLGIASFMLTALLAVFVGFLILFIRQVAVMILVIFAPFAIACYVLPGTQKAWGFWKDTFLSMLIVFPIISAMIAMGRVFAVVMYNDPAKDVPGFVSEIGAFIVYFAPYFMLPLAFRWAGGAMATVGGLVQNGHRGAFDKLKGFRQNQAAQRYERAHEGNLYHGNNRAAKAVNMLAWGGTNLNKAGYNPSKWRSKMHETHETQAYDEAMEMLEKNSALRAIANDNNALKAARMLAQGKSNQYVRGWLEQNNVTGAELAATMTRAEMVQKSGNNKAVQIATFMADASSGTGWDATKVTGPDGKSRVVVGSAFNKYAADLAEVAGGDTNLGMRMYGDSKGAMARSRPEMAGQDFMVGWNEIDKQMKGGQANGATVSLDAFMHMDAGTISRAKDDAQLDLMGAARQALTNQVDQSNQVNPALSAKVADIATGLAAAQNSGHYASPQAVKILADTLRDAPPEVKNTVNEAMRKLGR